MNTILKVTMIILLIIIVSFLTLEIIPTETITIVEIPPIKLVGK